MTPMMSRPLPRPVGKKRFKSEEKVEGKKPVASLALVAMAVLVVGSAAVLLYGAYRTSTKRKPRKHRVPKSTQITATLEHGDDWYMDPSGVRLPRAKKLLAEAKGAKPGRTRHKTSLMEINLRTLATEKLPVAEDEKARDKLADEVESDSGVGAQPPTPKPRPTDKRGRILPGEGEEGPAVE